MSFLHSPIYDSLMARCEDSGKWSSLIKWDFFLVSERQEKIVTMHEYLLLWWILLPYCDITLAAR